MKITPIWKAVPQMIFLHLTEIVQVVDGVILIQIARELARDVTFKFFITFQIVTIISMVTI